MAQLRRTLGLASLTVYGVGAIIGAGIYSIIGAAAGEAGDSLWHAFILAAVVAALSALSYAELVALVPKVGGEYTYLRHAFPQRRWIHFLGGFIVALAGAATAATVAIAFGGYLKVFLPLPVWAGALAILAACTLVNIAGIRESSWAAVILTLIETGGLVLVIVAGLARGGIAEPLTAPPSPAILATTALLFFVYTGFEGVVNLAEEARRPERDVPRAVLLSLAITAGLYVMIALTVVSLADPEELASSDSPLALAAGRASPALGDALAWIALCATTTTALITFIAVSRLLLGMSRHGDLPAALARLLPGRRTPWVAAVAIFAAAAALLPAGGIETAASVSSLATLISFVGVNVCVIVLRRTRPDDPRPFRVPWAVRGVPVPTTLAILAAVLLATRFSGLVYLITAATLGVGALVYAVFIRGRRNHPQAPA